MMLDAVLTEPLEKEESRVMKRIIQLNILWFIFIKSIKTTIKDKSDNKSNFSSR